MPKSENDTEKLEDAYRDKTPEENVEFYRDFAATYDSDFAERLGYANPATIAETYLELAGGDHAPVADIGCGTGLVGAALGAGVVVDGMDITPEMLEKARDRGCYRDLYEVDLTGDLSAISNGYGAVLSSGAFTHGHLGPEVLISLFDIAAPGALFIIGVNSSYHQKNQFAPVLEQQVALGRISPIALRKSKSYSKPGHDHSDDISYTLIWKLT